LIKNLIVATGRRKTAIARIFLREGTGKIAINGHTPEEYFKSELLTKLIRQPLEVTASQDKFDILIAVNGGGIAGQAGACKHGIARALVTFDDSNRPSLRANKFLTRDKRMVERKKYGQRKARRRFQFSKR